jgi:hypothetical protein
MNKFFGVLALASSLSWAQSPFSNDTFTISSRSRASRSLYRAQPDFTKGECRARIKDILCLLDKPTTHILTEEPSCLPGGEQYAHHFEKLYDDYPEALQKMFCSLNVIYLEPDGGGTAYAGAVMNEETGKRYGKGAIMGIRKSILDSGLDLQTWATWKEQLSFGGSTTSYAPTPGLPMVNAHMSVPGASDFLYFVIAHEFGHIFDFANEINSWTCNEEEDFKGNPKYCLPNKGSWTEFSWKNLAMPNSDNYFPGWDAFCFYWCDGKTPAARYTDLIYRGLSASNFISSYATNNIMDDFAESLAYEVSYRNRGLSYSIDAGTGFTMDTIQKLSAPNYAPKRAYVLKFLERTDIIYP